MLKAELVKILSDKYYELKGTTLLPVKNEKGIEIPWLDIPDIYKPKTPIKPKKVVQTDRDIEELQRLKYLEDWAKQHVKVKKSKYDLSREKKIKDSSKYGTDEEYLKAIKRRRERQERAYEKKFEKIYGKKPSPLPGQKPKKEEEKTEPEHPIIQRLQGLLNRYIYLSKIKDIDNDVIEYYNNTLDKYSEILGYYNKIKNTLSKNDKKIVDKLYVDIDKYADSDEFNDKFND